MCRETHRQNAPRAYCALLLKTIKNIISINADASKLPFSMDIGMSRYYKYFRYQLPWVIVHSVNLNNKLVTCYLRLLRSVSSSVLDEYGPKWPPVAISGASSVDPQNCKSFSLPKLLWKWRNESSYFLFKLFYMDCFRYSLKNFIKSNNGSKLNFEVALNAQ